MAPTWSAEVSPRATTSLGACSQFAKCIECVEIIATKQSNGEQRQCDWVGNGTDASRMYEQWTRGKHANEAGAMAKKKPMRSTDIDEEESTARMRRMSIEAQVENSQPQFYRQPQIDINNDIILPRNFGF